MQYKLYGFLFLIPFLILSCGPSKELVQSKATVDSLHMVVEHLNNQILTQAAQCRDQISQLNGSLTTSTAQIAALKNQNEVAMLEAADCKRAKEAVAARMEELNQALAAKGMTMKDIQKKAADALMQFNNAGVEVSYKNGLVYISMQDELLFSTGSAKLGKNGQEALAVVAHVLNENPNLLIYVIGNTDSVKVSRAFTDNWSLSTERANAVVRILRDQYQVGMDRVVSAGRGKYNPVADNSTAEGRARNRRTDIILNPDLSGLWYLVDKEQ